MPGRLGQIAVVARWVPVKLIASVLVRPWKVLGATAGRVKVARRLSEPPAVSEAGPGGVVASGLS